ncbi:MAG: antitermination protein NusG [Bacteroidetes bacterium HGW-Bacteroidetes-9]|jgi:transcription antitermination factor NusG|nr:MAG: antitermination protein NusG [Bacteroidetes bacterium HGW-Bacteroidetes-9]
MNEPVKPALLVDSAETRWFACYTKPRAEKVTAARIAEAGVECYLPLQRVRRRWSDRMKWVEEPLIRSYVFVKVSRTNFRKVLFIEGFLRFITFENKAVPIPDSQIEALHILLGADIEVEVTTENFEPGKKVEVISGQLIGLKGELVEKRGSKKVLVRLGEIGHGILVTIDTKLLEKV